MSIDVNQVALQYGLKVRLRVCGILISDDKILMVKHEPLGAMGYLWSPPGGGVSYGADMKANLKREFLEETGLDVEVGEFMFVNEYLGPPIHALEVFFKIISHSGPLSTGTDPELPSDQQMIKAVEFLPFDEIKKMNPLAVHNVFRHCNHINHLAKLNGFFKFENNSTI